jgi:hypothetical protein
MNVFFSGEEYMLRRSSFFYLLGISSFLIIGFCVFLIINVAPPWNDPAQAITVVLILVFFSSAGIISILEGLKGKLVLNKQGILLKTLFHPHREIHWQEITRITYCESSGYAPESFIWLFRPDGTKLPISTFFKDIKFLKDIIFEHFADRIAPDDLKFFDPRGKKS